MTDADSICWFVARTRRGQELLIRDKLNGYGVQNFVPVTQTLKVRGGRRIKAIVPLIPNMVFLRASKSDACALANGRELPVFYVIDRSTNRMLVVPDKQMDDFIRVVTEEPDSVQLESFNPVPGQKVRIVSGRLQGVEGEVISASQDTYIVVSVGQLLSARVKVQKNCLEPVL